MTRVGRQGSYPCLRLFVIIFSDIRVYSMKTTFCLFRLDVWLLFTETESYPELPFSPAKVLPCWLLQHAVIYCRSPCRTLIELLGGTTMTTYVSLKLLFSNHYMYSLIFSKCWHWQGLWCRILHMYMMSQPHTLRVTKGVTLYISRKTRKQWISACFYFYTWNNRHS